MAVNSLLSPFQNLIVSKATKTPWLDKNGADIADIYVGSPAEMLFRCHRRKLCEVVPVFSKLLANSSTIHLPEVGCEEFDLLMEYVENGGTSIRTMSKVSWDPISFFSLAEKFELPSLQNLIMDTTTRYHKDTGQFASPQFERRGYQETSEGTMMSKYAGRSVRFLSQSQSDKDPPQWLQEPNDLPSMLLFGASSPHMLGEKELPSGISATAKMVYEVLFSEQQNNEGLHVEEIAQKLGILVRDVFEAGHVLLSKGFIYTTVDDEMWAVFKY